MAKKNMYMFVCFRLSILPFNPMIEWDHTPMIGCSGLMPVLAVSRYMQRYQWLNPDVLVFFQK